MSQAPFLPISETLRDFMQAELALLDSRITIDRVLSTPPSAGFGYIWAVVLEYNMGELLNLVSVRQHLNGRSHAEMWQKFQQRFRKQPQLLQRGVCRTAVEVVRHPRQKCLRVVYFAASDGIAEEAVM